MDTDQTIETIKGALAERRQNGSTTVPIDLLEAYLDRLKQVGSLQSPELRLQAGEHSHQWGVEMVRSGIEAGTQALKTCLLISGGSAAALLAFAGSAWSALKPEGVAALSQTMLYLGIAIFLTGLASSITYLAQYFFAERLSWHNRAGDICQWSACALVLAAYILVLSAYLQAGEMLTMFKMVKMFSIP